MSSKQNPDGDGRQCFMRSLTSYLGASIGTILPFLCLYWLFHFETWYERGLYIGGTLLVTYLVVKLVPKKYR